MKDVNRYTSTSLSNPNDSDQYPELTIRNQLMGQLSPERTCYDVKFYDLNLDIDVDRRFISGYNTITSIAVNDFQTLQVDLRNQMNIEKIVYSNSNLEFSRNEDAVFIQFPAISAGSEFYFTVHYSGTPREAPRPAWDDGFVWEKDKAGRHFVAVTSEGLGASHWWPCKDHIADEPDSMAINISVSNFFFKIFFFSI